MLRVSRIRVWFRWYRLKGVYGFGVLFQLQRADNQVVSRGIGVHGATGHPVTGIAFRGPPRAGGSFCGNPHSVFFYTFPLLHISPFTHSPFYTFSLLHKDPLPGTGQKVSAHTNRGGGMVKQPPCKATTEKQEKFRMKE